MQAALVLLAVLAVICTATSVRPASNGVEISDRVVLETENGYELRNPAWKRVDEAAPKMSVTFRLYLKQRNLDKLNEVFEAVSNPDSEEYGNYWSQDRITSLLSPPIRERARVIKALKAAGVETIVDGGDVIKCTATVASASRFFMTSFVIFEHETTKVNVIRQIGAYSIPKAIHHSVEFITGLSAFPVPPKRTARSRPATPEDQTAGKVVPYVIALDYGIPQFPAFTTNKNSSVCLAEFQDDRSFSATDLSTFQLQNGLPNITVVNIVGPYSPSVPDAEATLDVQYGSAIAINATVWFWTVNGWMLEFANDFYNTTVVPYIVSMSWGWPEDSQCQIAECNGYSSQQYVQRTNTEFQKIGLRGVTLLASSGDQGAPGDNNPYCANTAEPISTIFPGASPYVTSVGATMFQPNSTTALKDVAAAPPVCSSFDCADPTSPEVSCSFPDALITSGGGFSDYSPRPSWQSAEVSSYLSSATGLPPAQYFNNSNRGFPDISALGHNYLIYISGRWELVDGTSCSSPVIGGMVALFNDWLLNNKYPTLGFIAPLLYKMYESDNSNFKDITVGNNKCTESLCCQYGFPAQAGWDAVTGLGVPVFNKMMAYIQANPPGKNSSRFH